VRIMALALLMSVVCGFAIGLVDGEFTKLMIYTCSVLILSSPSLQQSVVIVLGSVQRPELKTNFCFPSMYILGFRGLNIPLENLIELKGDIP
jgi:hypothetical protein